MRQHPQARRHWFPEASAWRVTLVYVVTGIAWVTVSDWAFHRLVPVTATWLWLNAVKASLFIAVTGALLYFALAQLQARNRRVVGLLAESENAYRRMFADNPNPMFVYDVQSLAFLAVNEAAIAHYGYSRDQFLSMTIWDIRSADARSELEQVLAYAATDPSSPRQHIVRHLCRNGREIMAEVSSHALAFRGHEARLVLAQDVTQRLRSEAQLIESRQQLREAQRIARMGSWSRDLDSGETEWSDEVWHILGLDPIAVPPGHEIFEQMLHPDDRLAVLQAHTKLQEGERLELEHRICRPDGVTRHVIEQMELVRQGKQRRLVGTILDVTERKLAAQALADSERKYRQLVELMPDGLLIHDGETVLFANAAMAALLGAPGPAQLYGTSAWRFFDKQTGPDEGPLATPGVRDRTGAVVPQFHPRLLRRLDGAPVEVEIALVAVRLDDRPCVQAVVRDLRARNRMQAALAQANERLSRLSTQIIETGEQERRQIARELHDDVGQLLTFMKMTASWLRRHAVDEEARARSDALLAVVCEALEKVRDLALLLRPRLLDTQGLAAAIEAHLERYLNGMDMAWTFDCEPSTQRSDPAVEIALFRIFQEAVTNAIKHSGADRLDVSLKTTDAQLWLRVADNGHGFERDRAFVHGTSLGLLTMTERAHLLGGSLTIFSDAGGTEIRASVPNRATPLPTMVAQEKAGG